MKTMHEDIIDMGYREPIQLIIAPGREQINEQNHIREEKFSKQKKEYEY